MKVGDGVPMKIQLYVHPNINGKILVKRVNDIIEEYNFTDAALEVYSDRFRNHDGILYTPTIVINDKVVSSGKLLSKQEIDTLLRSHRFKK